MSRYTGEKCLICSQDFKEDDDVVVCPECGTPYHKDCYKEKGSCVKGCAFFCSLSLMVFLFFLSIPSRVEEEFCAEVKIEILQELTMERQGFEALMQITN